MLPFTPPPIEQKLPWRRVLQQRVVSRLLGDVLVRGAGKDHTVVIMLRILPVSITARLP